LRKSSLSFVPGTDPLSNTLTTYYVYDGEKPILEYDSSGTRVGFNLYGKGVDEILERGAFGSDNQWHWYFLQQNHEGSITHLIDASHNVIERYRYDAFGAPTIYDGNWNVRSATIYDNRFLFTGREYAATYRSIYTGTFTFYEYRARAYNPALGRFMSEDPKLFDAGDYNLFRYCHNDPIDMTDPMGLTDAQVTYNPREESYLKALQHALGWPGHGAIQMGLVNLALERAFTVKVGIEATRRAEAAMGNSQIPYSVATMRYEDTNKVAYGDPIAGKRRTDGGYEELIITHHEKFADFRANPSLWNGGKGWGIFVIGHTHPLLRSQAPGFSPRDKGLQDELSRAGHPVSLFKNNPNWPGHVYDARMLGPNGWEVSRYSESGKLLSQPESD
jgi:RHS repeat-associated protein